MRNTAGEGDGVLAGLAYAISRGEIFQQGLLYGFALACAILQTLETADFLLQDYQDLLPQIQIQQSSLDRLPSLIL